MSLAIASLPSDPDELRAFAAALQVEVHAKTLYIEKLKAELAALRRARFGRSSEKLDRTIEQLELAISEHEDTIEKGRARLGEIERAKARNLARVNIDNLQLDAEAQSIRENEESLTAAIAEKQKNLTAMVK